MNHDQIYSGYIIRFTNEIHHFPGFQSPSLPGLAVAGWTAGPCRETCGGHQPRGQTGAAREARPRGAIFFIGKQGGPWDSMRFYWILQDFKLISYWFQLISTKIGVQLTASWNLWIMICRPEETPASFIGRILKRCFRGRRCLKRQNHKKCMVENTNGPDPQAC